MFFFNLLCFNVFRPPVGLVFGNPNKSSIFQILNIQTFNFSLAPYLKFFGSSSFEFEMVYVYSFKAIFTKRSLYFTKSMEHLYVNKDVNCNGFLGSISRNQENVEINKEFLLQ